MVGKGYRERLTQQQLQVLNAHGSKSHTSSQPPPYNGGSHKTRMASMAVFSEAFSVSEMQTTKQPMLLHSKHSKILSNRKKFLMTIKLSCILGHSTTFKAGFPVALRYFVPQKK